jgi:tetratricopeptide (TPR) repeat protein/GTP-binding protein EngB required for normal cell division
LGLWDRLSRRLDELAEELLPEGLRDTVDGARDLIQRGELGAAVAALDRALAEKPDHATALYLLGIARLRQGEHAAAAAAFSRARDVRAGFTEATVGLGEAKLSAGDAAAAVPLFREAIAQRGDREVLADAYRGLGRAWLLSGQEDKGIRELRKALAEDPDDVDAVIALVEALLPRGAGEEARAPLARVCRGEAPPAAALAALGRLELAAGNTEEAAALLPRALAATPALAGSARLVVMQALVEALLARGDTRGAHELALRAMEIAPRVAGLYASLAEIHRRANNVDAALDALDTAIDLGAGDRAWIGMAWTGVEWALEFAHDDRAPRYAALLLSDPHAMSPPTPATAEGSASAEKNASAGGSASAEGSAWTTARQETARALLALVPRDASPPDLASAREALTRALARAPLREALLLSARLDLAVDRPAAAAAQALTLLRAHPDYPPARALFADASRRAFALDRPAGDLYALAVRFHELTLAPGHALGALAADAGRAVESYDRPLLVTVMGEFSSGKSTFVNAFLGAEVAPVGITPTTATINVLKYGRERAARVVYHDDRVRDLAWDEAPRVLLAIDRDEARRVRQVEILYPLDSLGRVNLVDTPGLNSILVEHEATARQFIAQADAVVWLFTAGQAGKASEREALEHIRAEGKRVLGVVNKVDQVPDEIGTIVDHLRREVDTLVEDLVPVSARRALAARLSGQSDDPSWTHLEAALESRFFRRARALKRDAIAKRLGALLAAARDDADARAADARERDERLARAAAAVRADAVILARTVLPEERRRLAERVAAAYRAAARDVLELVRPRKSPFGAHSATAADRDYLVGFMERALADAIEPTRQRVTAELRRAADDAAAAARAAGDSTVAPAVTGQIRDTIDLLQARVFERARAYLRGYLRGGRIDEFFARALPKLELVEDSVYHALVRDAPDLEAELSAPLAHHAERALREVAAHLDGLAAAARAQTLQAEALVAALAAWETERAALALAAATETATP